MELQKKEYGFQEQMRSVDEQHTERLKEQEDRVKNQFMKNEELGELQKQVQVQFEDRLKQMQKSVEQAQKQNQSLQETILNANLQIKEKEANIKAKQAEIDRITEQKAQDHQKLTKYADQLKKGYEQQLQSMLVQYNQKLGAYEGQLK